MDILLIVIAAYLSLSIIRKLMGPKVETISGSKLDEMIAEKQVKRQFVDVRTSTEFSSRKIKGFRNIPLDVLSKRMKELDSNQPIVLLCASGSRSMKAARILNKAGYKKLINVRGGISTYPGK